MKLASLKQTYSDNEKTVSVSSEEYYPSLYLYEKQLDAMGIDTARVGSEMTMIATVRVSSISDSKNGSRSMSFEIIEAGVKPKEEAKDASSVLFPEG